MSATVTTKPANSPFERLHTKLRQMQELEEFLREQVPAKEAYVQQLEGYREAYGRIESQRALSPQLFENVEQVWKRLWWDIIKPEEELEQRFSASAQQLGEECFRALKALEEAFKKRARLLQTWNEYNDEVSFRCLLLDRLEEQMELFEVELARGAQEWATLELDAIEPLEVEEVAPAEPAAPAESRPPALVPPPLPDSRPSGIEERRYPRIHLGTRVKFGMYSHEFFTGFTENISSGGIFIATYEIEPRIGDRFELALPLPCGHEIHATGEVAWLRGDSKETPELSPGFGCRLLDLSLEDQRAIDRFIAQRGSMFLA